MRVGSLFSGIGGIEIGLERAGGFTTEWFIEKDPYAQAILKKHWPNTKIYDDVEKVDFRSVPRVDVITGGFPCQDISNAGKRAGIEGSRSGLWAYCAEAVRTLRPKVALFENVAALTGRGLNRVLADLAEIGYDAEWYCFPAKAVGAPHQRDRIIIISFPNSECFRCHYVPKRSQEESKGHACSKIGGICNVANTNQKRLQRSKCEKRPYEERWSVENGKTRKCRASRKELCSKGIWAVEPDVGRVANGIPNRVDRIKCLGNAVVPAWAEAIAKAIKEETQ
jgi:DNA (cytosine-5)-methyltransferase 1